MKIIYFDKFWNINDTIKYKDYLFIFGDNDKKIGNKGQACIRNTFVKNTAGIPTKKEPNFNLHSYYNDNELELNKEKINNAIDIIIHRLKNEKFIGIIMPKNGLGTGLADLQNKAPLTFKYLNSAIDKLIKIIENI
jgi:hypothetical protein